MPINVKYFGTVQPENNASPRWQQTLEKLPFGKPNPIDWTSGKGLLRTDPDPLPEIGPGTRTNQMLFWGDMKWARLDPPYDDEKILRFRDGEIIWDDSLEASLLAMIEELSEWREGLDLYLVELGKWKSGIELWRKETDARMKSAERQVKRNTDAIRELSQRLGIPLPPGEGEENSWIDDDFEPWWSPDDNLIYESRVKDMHLSSFGPGSFTKTWEISLQCRFSGNNGETWSNWYTVFEWHWDRTFVWSATPGESYWAIGDFVGTRKRGDLSCSFQGDDPDVRPWALKAMNDLIESDEAPEGMDFDHDLWKNINRDNPIFGLENTPKDILQAHISGSDGGFFSNWMNTAY